MRLRRIGPEDVPRAIGWQRGPRQTIFRRDPEGDAYADPVTQDKPAFTTAWLGLTREPRPRKR